MISAMDINKGRLRILEETAKLQRVDNVITCIHADLRSFSVSHCKMRTSFAFCLFFFVEAVTFYSFQDSNTSKFDKVLLDVPCSGLGVLSKVGGCYFVAHIIYIFSFSFCLRSLLAIM